MYTNINGKLAKNAKISVLDPGFLYADGVYETLRTYHGRVFKASEHLKRLRDGAKKLGVTVPWSDSWIVNEIYRTIRKLKEARIRINVTKGVKEPNIIIMARQLPRYPKERYEKGVKAVTYKAERFLPEVKSLNFLPNMLALEFAKKKDAVEALLVNRKGYATEGAISNLFIVKNNVVITPKDDILKGVTRGIVLKLAKVKQKPITIKQLLNADECFITNTTGEITPVRQINNNKLGGPGPVTKKLMERFKRYVESWKV